MKHILLLVVICLSTLQVNSASTSRDSSIVPQIQNVSQTTSKSVNSQDNPKLKTDSTSKGDNNDSQANSDGKKSDLFSWVSLIVSFISAVFSAIFTYYTNKTRNKLKEYEIKMNHEHNQTDKNLKTLAIRMNEKSNQLSNEVKKLEIKMRTSDLVVAKRLEVFPKLHILTDTLGAAIRYYNNHISDEDNKEENIKVLKEKIKEFHLGLSYWDANYCIFAGKTLTFKVGNVRKRLEKEEDWVEKKDISKIEADDLYKGLTDIEAELKKEMKIHFTEYEEMYMSNDNKLGFWRDFS